GSWDLIVVDCAPTAETLRLLALPEALGWYMDRVLPVERRVVKTLKPVLTRATGVPMPQDSVFDAVTRLHADLADVRAVLTSEDASVRMVLTPEAVVVAEARRSLTSLSLYGYRVDGVIANRIFPSAGGDAWRRQWVAAQATILADVEASFAPLDTWRSAYWPCEPVGLAELAAFATAAYGDSDPFQRPQGPEPVLMRRVGPGAADEEEYGASGGPADRASDAGADGRRGWGGSAPMAGADVLLRVHLPFAERGDVDLARHGDELVVTVGSYRRLLALPAALRRSDVVHAQLDDGALQVRFSPRGRP
ncbi:MAG: ArsA family ATPase, partial [Nocardioidaceae bacterium]